MATEDIWGLFVYKMRVWSKRNGPQKYAELSERLADWSKKGSTPFMSQIEGQVSLMAVKKKMETDRFLEELFDKNDVDDFVSFLESGAVREG